MAGRSSLTKPFTYFLYFQRQGLAYFGRAASSFRYPGIKPGELFTGPHHNPDVNKALVVEPAIWVLHREYDTIEQCKKGEEEYLSLYWPIGSWPTRPKWLLNRSNSAGGAHLPLKWMECIEAWHWGRTIGFHLRAVKEIVRGFRR